MTTNKPRILFVGAFPSRDKAIFGGMVTACRALLASTFPECVDLDLLDSTQKTNPPPSLFLRSYHALTRIARFLWRIPISRPDAVLMFVSSGASVAEKGAMAWYARIWKVPSILFPRSGAVVNSCSRSKLTRWWVRMSFRGASRIVCQSEVWRIFAVEEIGFAPGSVSVIRNWTATPELLRIGAERQAHSGSSIKLVFVGWLEREKGIFELIECCSRLCNDHEFLLDIVGEGRASREARDLVAEYGLDEVVRFRGWLAEPEVREVLSSADVFVLPSWAEGLPNALVEAMSARLAPVVTNVGAIPDFITNRQNALLVEPCDVDSLTIALREVVTNSRLRVYLATNAYQTAREEFGVEFAVPRILAVIEDVTATAG